MGRLKDLTGQRFGRLQVESFAGVKTRQNGQRIATWNCVCDCGNRKIVESGNLSAGKVKSCGCLCRDRTREVNFRHGLSSNGNKTRLYQVWANMKQRCYNENHKSFKYYGERGISVCDEWLHSFSAFYQWAVSNGYSETAPKGKCTLDRIDPNGDYSPQNCRFTTVLEQQNNRRISKRIVFDGVEDTLSNHARRRGIDIHLFYTRLSLGWSVERALTQPVKERKKKNANREMLI